MASVSANPRWLKILCITLLVLYFLFLVIARVPATWAAWAVQESVPGTAFAGVSGTVWQGSATVGTAVVGGQPVSIQELHWRVQPWRLLSLNVCARAEAQLMGQPASGLLCRASDNTVIAQNLQASAPMAMVGQWLQLELAGQASLQLRNASVTGQYVNNLDGSISWRDARWYNGEQWVNLGAFAAELSASDQGGVAAKIFELDGPFSLQLDAHILPDKEPVVQGTVQASEQAPPQIREALELLSVPLGDDRFRVAWPPGT